MKIDRSKLISDLEQFARSGNGVVIGPPGIGKSYALAELRNRLKQDQTPHLILPVERLGTASDAEIRAVLQKDGDFVLLLNAAVNTSNKKAVLIFDGYDSARGENERAGVFQLILRAINGLRGRWNILVSVRTFDAKKSKRLLELFPDAEAAEIGASCRQFQIPFLSEDEISQAFQQIPGLQGLHRAGTNEFQALLKVPFNLWLIERILKAGAEIESLSHITSEVQLLQLYWDCRVNKTSNGEDREYILRKITSQMVESHKLTARRDQIYEPRIRDAWMGLLSDEVLTEDPEVGTQVGFTHNILFDFAVCVHLLDWNAAKFAQFISEDPGRPLFIRPSLVYHFNRIWHFNRYIFWENFWSVIQQQVIHVRQIVRLVLPIVIVNEARSLEDLQPLLDRLDRNEAGAVEASVFLLQALRILHSQKLTLWSEFLNLISKHLDDKIAWDAGAVANWIMDTPSLNETVRSNCGSFSRRLFQWAWSRREDSSKKSWYERLVAFNAVPLIAKTYGTDVKSSREQVIKILNVLSEPSFSIDCIYRLTNEIGRIFQFDPEFAAELYEKIFGFCETSSEQTSMGGPVIGFISNRRQDYEMCRYSLTQQFSSFLRIRPFHAIPAGIRAVQAFKQENIRPYLKRGRSERELITEFSFRGKIALYIEDGSSIWDTSPYPDQEIQIADEIFKWLANAAAEDRVADIEMFLKLFATEAVMAFLWARLLNIGALQPAAVGTCIWELAKANPFLQRADTLYALGGFLEKAFPLFSQEQKTEVERAILALSQPELDENKEFWIRRRNLLVARLKPDSLTTTEALELYNDLKARSGLPENHPRIITSSSWSRDTEETFLRERGAKLELPENQRVLELFKPLVTWRDGKKEESEIDPLIPKAWALREILKSPIGADESVLKTADLHLASFALEALRITKVGNTDRFQKLRTIVLEAADSKDPEPNPAYDSNWSSPSWSPAPRTEAAQALPWLTHFGVDKEALDAIRKLVVDPVPSVRFLVACELWRLAGNHPEVLWELLSAQATDEPNEVVLQGITISLGQLTGSSRESVIKIIQILIERLPEEEEDDEKTRSQLVTMIIDFAIWMRNEWAIKMLSTWREDPLKYCSSMANAGHRLIQYITPGHSGETLERAKDFCLLHLDAVEKGLRILRNSNGLEKDQIQKKWKLLYGIIDQSISQIRFATDTTRHPIGENERTQINERNLKFFRDVSPIMEKVLTFAKQEKVGMLLAPTAHNFVELLNQNLKYDPPLVIRMVADVINCSKPFNYNLDALAMAEIVKLVESVFGDYRDKIQDDVSIRNLLTILDAFVEAGWPEALNLVWRLDEIFR